MKLRSLYEIRRRLRLPASKGPVLADSAVIWYRSPSGGRGCQWPVSANCTGRQTGSGRLGRCRAKAAGARYGENDATVIDRGGEFLIPHIT